MERYNVGDQEDYLLGSNLLGAKSLDELAQLEAIAFSLRSSQLEAQGFDWFIPLTISSLKKLHWYLFQDVYAFAGQLRTVQLMKANTRFCQAEHIESNLERILAELQAESEWATKAEAAGRLAHYKTELNMIHPFREGNGRTIRLVIREIARARGYEWNFHKIERESYIDTMVRSVFDEGLLRKCIEDTLSQIER